jgi:hypothetical protein
MNKKQIVMEDNLSIYDENVASYSPAPPILHNNNMQAFGVERTNSNNRYMDKSYSLLPSPLSNNIRATCSLALYFLPLNPFM